MRSSADPDTKYAFVPNFATLCIITKPFQIDFSFCVLEAFAALVPKSLDVGDLGQNNPNYMKRSIYNIAWRGTALRSVAA